MYSISCSRILSDINLFVVVLKIYPLTYCCSELCNFIHSAMIISVTPLLRKKFIPDIQYIRFYTEFDGKKFRLLSSLKLIISTGLFRD